MHHLVTADMRYAGAPKARPTSLSQRGIWACGWYRIITITHCDFLCGGSFHTVTQSPSKHGRHNLHPGAGDELHGGSPSGTHAVGRLHARPGLPGPVQQRQLLGRDDELRSVQHPPREPVQLLALPGLAALRRPHVRRARLRQPAGLDVSRGRAGLPQPGRGGGEGGPKTYWEGCPEGYAAAAVSSRPGYDYYKYTEGSFDISYYQTTCCPTVYPFQARTLGQGQSTSTSHDGTWYSVYVYPMPECYATCIKALSGGKELPMQTTSNTQVWDKRQETAAPEPTTWNYEDGTLYALPQILAHTVFMGTHTCYEDCSTWMQHYYPDMTGAPGERNTETGERRMPRPSETEGGEENNPPPPTATATNEGGGSSKESNPSPSPTATATNGGDGESTPTATADGSGGSGSESGGDDGIESIEPEDPSDKGSSNSQSPDVSLASRIRGEFNLGSCSIVALMIPLLVATLVL
ncbi:hypothetical protein PG993_012940 [Apiospora rasikravindrae]|uniref:Uncharacterized protein n=1 Tax=Apiospora rasikravindrae TaxID=990691 RepID=A0ABR1RWC1_9PEZI